MNDKAVQLENQVFSIPAGAPFAKNLVDGLLATYSDPADPLKLASVTVLLPTRRAVRAVADAFLARSSGRPLILPALRPIGDVEEEALTFDVRTMAVLGEGLASEMPPPISALRRQLLLSRLVEAWSESTSANGVARSRMGPGPSAALAAELAAFMDMVDTEQAGLSGLDKLAPDAFAAHWQETLEFLKIVTESWPKILEEEGAINPSARRSALIEAQAEFWREKKPDAPVILAGSTGSIPATVKLMQAILELPKGTLVLPGLDLALDDPSWEKTQESHPQFGLRQLLERLECKRSDVKVWPFGADIKTPKPRREIIQECLRPAETTDRWQTALKRGQSLEEIEDAFEGFDVIEAADPGEEARSIALIMRETVEHPTATCVLVTPDRQLARRVSSELHRWNLEVNDSAGVPLDQTPPMTFLKSIIRCWNHGFHPVDLLSLLKHPLCRLGIGRPKLRSLAASLEVHALRGPRPAPGIEGLRQRIEAGKPEAGLSPLLDALSEAFAPLNDLPDSHVAIEDLVTAHIACAELVGAAGPDTETSNWSGEAGEAAASFVSELLTEADVIPPMSAGEYMSLFDELLTARVVRPRFGTHPRLFIWGPLEARLQEADTVILGGLNEKTWPAEANIDPWLSRPMREALKLPPPERRIGLSAHDFAQLASAPRVFLTRSEREGTAPTVPSRWLLRLQNLMRGLNASDCLTSNVDCLHWSREMDRPARFTAIEEPKPRPPVSARPRELAVTDIERWIRDPYAIYAKKILRLNVLDPIDADATALDRGIVVHRALERFVDRFSQELPENAFEALIDIGREVFDEISPAPDVKQFWWSRFLAIADWFIAWEAGRRPELRPLAVEAKGILSLEAKGGDFVVTARADRIDRRESDGSIAIFDYKTGSAPSKKQVSAGLSPQLSLEALIAQEGGFEKVGRPSVAELAYIELKGGDPAGIVKLMDPDVQNLVDKVREGLKGLIDLYDIEDTPYLARLRPMFDAYPGPYDHLARVKEWSVYGSKE